MWSSDRRHFLTLAAATFVAACGFTPLHAPGGSGAALRGQVAFADPTTRDGFDYVNRLEDRLGKAASPAYRLEWTVEANPVGAGVTPAGAITRYSLKGKASYILVSQATGQTVTSGQVESFTSWSTSGSTVSTLSAEDDAHRRLMIILADQTVSRLYAAQLK